MQMRHRFAAVRSIVDDEAITIFSKTNFFGDFAGFEEDVAQDFGVFGLCFRDARKNFFGKNQNVRGRLRMNVADGHDQIVFINNCRRNFTRGNFFKEGLAHAES